MVCVVNPLLFVILLNVLNKILPSLAHVLYPFFIPATILAVMMTLYIIYDMKKQYL